jgi:hypothetical protein
VIIESQVESDHWSSPDSPGSTVVPPPNRSSPALAPSPLLVEHPALEWLRQLRWQWAGKRSGLDDLSAQLLGTFEKSRAVSWSAIHLARCSGNGD